MEEDVVVPRGIAEPAVAGLGVHDLGERMTERAGDQVRAGEAETGAVLGDRGHGAPRSERGPTHRAEVAARERDRIGGVERGLGDAEELAECRVVRAVSHHVASSHVLVRAYPSAASIILAPIGTRRVGRVTRR